MVKKITLIEKQRYSVPKIKLILILFFVNGLKINKILSF
jgi:hypothetical protein